jgi:hypothetical protein
MFNVFDYSAMSAPGPDIQHAINAKAVREERIKTNIPARHSKKFEFLILAAQATSGDRVETCNI